MSKEIILASGSQTRRILLESLNIPFKVIPSNFDERLIKETEPIQKVQETARAKAHKIAVKHKGFIIAADTLGVFNGREFQKPADLASAKEMLKSLSGQIGQLLTGICILDTERQKEVTTFRAVTVQCKELTNDEIDRYITEKPVTEWAAAYNPLDEVSSSIFKPLGEYIYRIEYYSLPIDVIIQELKEIGIEIDSSRFKI